MKQMILSFRMKADVISDFLMLLFQKDSLRDKQRSSVESGVCLLQWWHGLVHRWSARGYRPHSHRDCAQGQHIGMVLRSALLRQSSSLAEPSPRHGGCVVTKLTFKLCHWWKGHSTTFTILEMFCWYGYRSTFSGLCTFIQYSKSTFCSSNF